MLKGYLRALIDRYYRSYEIALKNKDSEKAAIFNDICDDLTDMMHYINEIDKPNSKGKHVVSVFVGKSAEFGEFLKDKGGIKFE